MSFVAVAVGGAAVVGAGASMYAANKQAGAAKDAANLTAGQYNTTRGDLAPYRESGSMALDQLNYLLGLGGPGGSSAAPQQSQFMMAGPAGAGGLAGVGHGKPAMGATASWGQSGGSWGSPIPSGGPAPQQVPDVAAYQAALAKYNLQQQQTQNDPRYGSLLQPFSLDKFQQSPDYQFNLQQGQMAIDKSANARGNFYAPQTLQDISKYSQGLASQEFQQAYNMYNTDQNNIYSRLFNQVGVGQSAANQTGAYGANAANTQAGLVTGGGAAQAAGIMGAGQSLSQLAYLPQLLQQNQAPSYGPGQAQQYSPGMQALYSNPNQNPAAYVGIGP